MKILWLILVPFYINSCSYEQQDSIEFTNRIDKIVVDSLKEVSSQNMKDKIEKSISHLVKIIERNENKISNWELDLTYADSIESNELQIDINQMKNRIIIQKERLRRLKSKDD